MQLHWSSLVKRIVNTKTKLPSVLFYGVLPDLMKHNLVQRYVNVTRVNESNNGKNSPWK